MSVYCSSFIKTLNFVKWLGSRMESRLKKLFLILVILGSYLLIFYNTILSTSSTDLSMDSNSITSTKASENIQITSVDDNNLPDLGSDTNTPKDKPTSFPSSNQLSTSMETFKGILLNKIPFFCTDKTPYYTIVHQWNGYLNELTSGDKPMIISQFAVIDLDGNTIPEIVLAIEDYMGFVILRYKEEGKVVGNIVSYRSMYSLKKDGSFNASSGSNDTLIGKMVLIGDTYFHMDKISSVGGGNTVSYYIHDMPIDNEIWRELTSSFDNQSDIEWNVYSKETIEQLFIDNSTFYKLPNTYSMEDSNRQSYLDSLIYLIDMTSRDLKSQEETNANNKSYYNSCNDEMNKIYQLCLEKLSGDEREALTTDQKNWQESFNQRLSEYLSEYCVNSMDDLERQSGYYTFGTIMLKRTISLINLYYDCHFYD